MNNDNWQWTDNLVKEMIYSKLPVPDHYIANVQKCLDEFKESKGVQSSSVKDEDKSQDEFIKKHLDIIWKKTKQSQIQRFIKPMFDSLQAASIKYFLEKGTVNGSFEIALNNMMDAVRNWQSKPLKDEVEDKEQDKK